MAHLITLGLPFLRRLLTRPMKEQKRLVFENLSVDCEMAKLVTKEWINRDHSRLVRRRGEQAHSTAAHHNQHLTTMTAMTPTPAAAAARPGLPEVYSPTDSRGEAPSNAQILMFGGD